MNGRKARRIRRATAEFFSDVTGIQQEHSNVRQHVIHRPTGSLNPDGTQVTALFAYTTSTVTIPRNRLYRRLKELL